MDKCKKNWRRSSWGYYASTARAIGPAKRLSREIMNLYNLDIKRELKILAAAREHKSLFVHFNGWYEQGEHIYIVMEYMKYGDLAQYMKRLPDDTRRYARFITQQLLEALDILHSSNICHRDLKPQNILISSLSPLSIKIADFGFAKHTAGTNLKTCVGTNGYMAPELQGFLPPHMRRSGPRGERTFTYAIDMWSLGCIVYTIFTSNILFSEAQQAHDLDETSGIIQHSHLTYIDNAQLVRFCNGGNDYVITETLMKSGARRECINFVLALLVADPEKRSTAAQSLRHPWILSQPSANSYAETQPPLAGNDNNGYISVPGDKEEYQSTVKVSTGRDIGDEKPTLDNLFEDVATATGIYQRKDGTQEIEEMEQAVTEGRQTLGGDHSDTLSAMESVASIYFAQERWDEAEKLQQHVVEARQKTLGSSHPETLSAMVGLATIYWNQKSWEEAEEIEQQVVDIRERTLGSKHPDTLSVIASLAVSYRMQGQYTKAEELHQQVTEATKRLRGIGHPHTMVVMANLASTYCSQERWEETEELQKLIRDTKERQLGREHPDTQRAIASLAATYRKLGRHNNPQKIKLKPVDPRPVVPSYKHPSTLEETKDLVGSFVSQGRIEDLQQLIIETVERRGAKDMITTFLMLTVSWVYNKYGYYDQASALKKQAVEALQTIGFGPENIVELSGLVSIHKKCV